MADQYTTSYTETPKVEEPCETPAPAVESTDRGLFGFGKKDEEKKCEEEVIATEFDEKVKVTEEEPKHESLAQKLHRSDSSSSSSSEEEYVDENGEKKKKKKLKDRLKDKISGGEKKEEEKAEVKYEDTAVPIEKCDDVPEGEKKGFLEKIKDKLPGGKKTEEVAAPPADCYAAPPPPVSESYAAAPPPVEAEKEKKGFLEKIKEKIPGYHPKTEEEKEKEKEKESC